MDLTDYNILYAKIRFFTFVYDENLYFTVIIINQAPQMFLQLSAPFCFSAEDVSEFGNFRPVVF